ncbi:LysE family translocator [Eionea flava]
MLDLQTWFIFLSSALALAFAPGPGILYVLSRTIAGGRFVGMASTLGCAVGGVVHVIFAALGVSVILAKSASAMMILKYLGAAFLIYLGMKMLYSIRQNMLINNHSLKSLEQADPMKIERDVVAQSDNFSTPSQDIRSAFFQGIIAEILNPKTAIFFLAFIPQFVHPEQGDIFQQFIVLGMVVVVINMIPDVLIAYFAHPVARHWQSNARIRAVQTAASGSCLLGLGAYLAISDLSVSNT